MVSWNHLETYGFPMISGGIKVNYFPWIQLIFAAKFGEDPVTRDYQRFFCLLVITS